MKIKIYQVDAFTNHLFGGNPAAICPLDEWLADEMMQNIAHENNLAETAFFVKKENGFHIRWFTPNTEVDLCGHATLATAHVIFLEQPISGNEITFDSRSGKLTVRKENNLLTLNFPADKMEKTNLSQQLIVALGTTPLEVYKGKTDYMLVYDTQEQIERIRPDFRKLGELEARGVIVTAKGKTCDFVSRFFAPKCGIDEDPVTGSAHTSLTPYWSAKLGKTELSALQLSKRKGYLKCKLLGGRVEIAGEAKLYLRGEIEINE
ncbi:MAG: PhzF family phenazine biosynthesis protein [Bacteroidetes bacterium]|nr:PhzF family phenazine biosynthesis protein [Bacteroidota bacterium]